MERHGYGIARMRLVQPSGWWCVLLFFFSLLSLLLSALIPLTDWNRSLLSSACCFPWYLAASQKTLRFASTRPFFLQLVPRSRTHGFVLRFVSFRLWISASLLNNCPPRVKTRRAASNQRPSSTPGGFRDASGDACDVVLFHEHVDRVLAPVEHADRVSSLKFLHRCDAFH